MVRKAVTHLELSRGSADNSVDFTFAATFTDARIRVFTNGGDRYAFHADEGDGTLTADGQTITWTPTADQTNMLTPSAENGNAGNSYTFDLKVDNVWATYAGGLIYAEGSADAIREPAAAGGGGEGGGVDAASLGHLYTAPYIANATYLMPGFIPVGGASYLITTTTHTVLIPVRFQQDVAISALVGCCGATVSNGKGQLAVYETDTHDQFMRAKGLPIAKSAAEFNIATVNTNFQSNLNTNWNVVAGVEYWIGLTVSASGCGLTAGYNPHFFNNQAASGAADMFATGLTASAYGITGSAYNSDGSHWSNLSLASGRPTRAQAYSPLLGFRKAA